MVIVKTSDSDFPVKKTRNSGPKIKFPGKPETLGKFKNEEKFEIFNVFMRIYYIYYQA